MGMGRTAGQAHHPIMYRASRSLTGRMRLLTSPHPFYAQVVTNTTDHKGSLVHTCPSGNGPEAMGALMRRYQRRTSGSVSEAPATWTLSKVGLSSSVGQLPALSRASAGKVTVRGCRRDGRKEEEEECQRPSGDDSSYGKLFTGVRIILGCIRMTGLGP